MVICYDSWRQEGHPAVKPMPQIARATVAGRSTVRAKRPTPGNHGKTVVKRIVVVVVYILQMTESNGRQN